MNSSCQTQGSGSIEPPNPPGYGPGRSCERKITFQKSRYFHMNTYDYSNKLCIFGILFILSFHMTRRSGKSNNINKPIFFSQLTPILSFVDLSISLPPRLPRGYCSQEARLATHRQLGTTPAERSARQQQARI